MVEVKYLDKRRHFTVVFLNHLNIQKNRHSWLSNC